MDTLPSVSEPGTVVIVEDDPGQQLLLTTWLESAGHRVLAFGDGEALLREVATLLPDVFILDRQLPGMDGIDLLRKVKASHPDTPAIMLTSDENVDTIMAATRAGALEYLIKPNTRTRVLTTVSNALSRRAMRDRVRELEREVEGWGFPGLIGTSAPMRALYRRMHRVALTDVTVLVQGESGTGKEVVARSLHAASPRARGPFVAVNCAAIPPTLQESELFGHERGAFTGATSRRQGRFEQAHGGTLFLDELAELGPGPQAQLLRVLQERRFHRVGGSREVESDFRLIAATHRELSLEVAAGRFREDLFFRVAVFELPVPPLRVRGGDLQFLAQTFARDFGMRHRGEPCTLAADAEAAIGAHDWPGNVRELQNAIQRAVLLSPTREIPGWALPGRVRAAGEAARPTPSASPDPSPSRAQPPPRPIPDEALAGLTLEAIERIAVEAAVRRHGGNRSRAAAELGIARTTLYRKLATRS